LLLIIPVLVGVAFITLLERKILGYSQLRKGPNKVSFIGILQPFNDAIKLFTKEVVSPSYRNVGAFNFRPSIAIFLSLLVWIVFPTRGSIIRISLGLVVIYMVLRMGVYPLIVSGWSSNSRYALIGRLRGVAQTISYEVRFALVLLFIITGRVGLRFDIILYRNLFWFKLILFPPLLGLWLIISLAETNRTPFDFAEGESELVSGFNVEYGRVGFALIFMAEYARIYFISAVISITFFSGRTFILYSFFTIRLVFFWVWVRTTLPRYRYDLLMGLAWGRFLPVTLILLIYATVFM